MIIVNPKTIRKRYILYRNTIGVKIRREMPIPSRIPVMYLKEFVLFLIRQDWVTQSIIAGIANMTEAPIWKKIGILRILSRLMVIFNIENNTTPIIRPEHLEQNLKL